MRNTHYRAFKFKGPLKQCLAYIDALELITRYEEVMGIDKPVTRDVLSKMSPSKVIQRAEIINKRWANA
jgi:hypothetical protein